MLMPMQVEHGITEMVAGVDLVAWQLELQGEFAFGSGLVKREGSMLCWHGLFF